MMKKAKLIIWLCGLVFLLSGCQETADSFANQSKKGTPFDASKKMAINSMLPNEGGMGTRAIIYGSNLGNDTATTHVFIGGKRARVLSSTGNALLCVVPKKAYSGEVKVSVTSDAGDTIATCQWDSIFKYSSNMVVSTFLGETYENNTKYDVKEGPFNDCGGFPDLRWMCFDPKDPDLLFVAAGKSAFRIIDFKNKYVHILKTNVVNCSGVNFTLNGDFVLSHDNGNSRAPSIFLFTRESGYSERMELCDAYSVQNVAVHPKNGKIYYITYHDTWIYSYNLETGENRQETPLPARAERYLVWHPSGEWCYMVNKSAHSIWRCDYDEATGTLSTPYLVAGREGSSGWTDGVGGGARMSKPHQGVFVKNPAYAGQKDEYDFYYVEEGSHCVRILTPEGVVTTYAGRAENKSGYRDGELRKQAQFNTPTCIAWDEKRNSFYIGDTKNYRIRRISPQDEL